MMTLYATPNSPYSRKVRIAAIEKGVISAITVINSPPGENAAELLSTNPLGKIPALALTDGRAIFDSPVICEYMDGLGTQNPLIPSDKEGRLRTRQMEALGDGIMDACVARYLELMRPETERSPRWIGRWEAAMARSLDYLENGREELPTHFDLGAISIASALDYVCLRYDSKWKGTHPKTAAWLEKMKERESMKATAPEV